MLSYAYVLATVLLTVYGQIVIKWQVLQAGAAPADGAERLRFLLMLLINPWVLSAFISVFLGALSWMLALSKLPLSQAYPFVGLSFVLVPVLSWMAFAEPLSWGKALGMALIVAGVAISSQG